MPYTRGSNLLVDNLGVPSTRGSNLLVDNLEVPSTRGSNLLVDNLEMHVVCLFLFLFELYLLLNSNYHCKRIINFNCS